MVPIRNVSQEKLDLLRFSACLMESRAQVLRRSYGASPARSQVAAPSLTNDQMLATRRRLISTSGQAHHFVMLRAL